MFKVFAVMRDLHELLWLIEEASALTESAPMRAELARMSRHRRVGGKQGEEIARVSSIVGDARRIRTCSLSARRCVRPRPDVAEPS